MKKPMFIFIMLGILYACNSDDDSSKSNTGLIGNWKLIEVLYDPGDGSGVFSVIESNKTITFEKEGVFTSNGEICSMTIEANNPTSGIYSANDLTPNDCNTLNFELNGDTLIINYLCIEPCRAKYSKQ